MIFLIFQGLTASAAEPQDRLEPESWRSCSRSSRRSRKRRRAEAEEEAVVVAVVMQMVSQSRSGRTRQLLGRPSAHTGCQETCRRTLRVRKRRPSKAKKCKKAVPEGLEEDAGRKVCREDPPKGDVNFWVRLRVAIWRHVGFQKRGQERQKSEKT